MQIDANWKQLYSSARQIHFFSSSILEISLNLIKVITLDSYNDGSCAMSIPRKSLITAITYARIRRRLRERAR